LADAEGIAPLLGELDYPSTPDEVARRLTAMSSAPETAAFVAEELDQIVGVATVQLLHVIHSDSGFTQLLLLAIAPDARRRGVGRALVGAAEYCRNGSKGLAYQHGDPRQAVIGASETRPMLGAYRKA